MAQNNNQNNSSQELETDFEKEFNEIDEKIVLKEGEISNNKIKEKQRKKNSINISILDHNEQKEKFLKYYEANKPKFINYGLSGLSASIVLGMLLIFLAQEDDLKIVGKNNQYNIADFKDLTFKKRPQFVNQTKESQVEELVKKANLLYSEGAKTEALQLYGRIATYNASLSYYNLGVARAKKGQWSEALEAFNRAIQNHEHITPSAINASVCSKELNDTASQKAYLELAYTHLPSELDSPLYSYYYSLIQFYRANYFETFSPLSHRSSEYFPEEQNMMESRINLLFENYVGSASALERTIDNSDVGNLGLIYANMGELKQARDMIGRALELRKFEDDNSELMRLRYADSLISLKDGSVREGGISIGNLWSKYNEKLNYSYSLMPSLQESLFDVQKAQQQFQKELQFSKHVNYQILFYFAPYKIFDAKQSINMIKKGTANISIGDNDEATGYLIDVAKSSDVNKNIVLAVREILNRRLRIGNKILKEVELNNPKHAVLHYDLGLSYAQLGDFTKAHEHFRRSFHLNSRDYLSGIFAILTGDLIGEDIDKLTEVLKENLALEPNNKELTLYETLLAFQTNGFSAMQNWITELDSKDKTDLFNLGFAYIITNILDKQLNNSDENKKISKMIASKLPNELLPHMLFLFSNYGSGDIKKFSKETISYFQSRSVPIFDFYYGSRISQEMWIKFAQLSGKLPELENRIRKHHNSEKINREGVIQAFAYTLLMNKKFEEAYQLYNKLIDDFGIKDSRTLFLAGVSAIGSKHFANAVALFELARLENKMNLETRYALGLLYLEAKNFEAGSILFKKFENENFFSDFFDFNVKIAENNEEFQR
jgi:tetratricopeptide (TPR) repeat protein